MSLLFALFVSCAVTMVSSAIVNTEYGPIEGFIADDMNKFLGIPFAKPPIDDLRFASPEESDSWSDTLSATGPYVNACLQNCNAEPPFCPQVQSEDCLYLNVWSPLDAEYQKTNYTVMVWIYGGSYNSGWSTFLLYDPTSFMNYIDDIIIVTINYRIGIFGWLYDNMYDTGVNGNFGEQDIQFALQWINKNIKYFGGNGDNIVIWGESAGANSVAIELLYNDVDYIAAGIMESPPLSNALRDNKTWYDVPLQFSNLIGCGNETNSNDSLVNDTDSYMLLDCWRSVDAENILSIQNDESLSNNWSGGIQWTPTAGTNLIPNQIVAEFQMDNIETPPFIIGTNKDEEFLFINDSLKDTVSYQNLTTNIITFFNKYAAKLIFNEYNISETQSFTSSYLYDEATILNDAWICSVRNVLQNTQNITNRYYYNFDVIDEPLYESVFWPDNPACWNRVCHFTEVFYVFLPQLFMEYDLLDNITISIGEQMQLYWSNYAKYLNPNEVDGTYIWSMFQNENVLIFNGSQKYISSSINDDYYDDLCVFWDYIGYAGDYIEESMSTTTSTPSQRESEKDLTDVINVLLIVLGVVVVIGVVLIIYYRYCGAKQKPDKDPKNYVELQNK